MTALGDLPRGVHDGSGTLPVEHPELGIDGGCGGLEPGERVDDPRGNGPTADREVLDRPGRLRAVEGVRRDLHLSHRVVFGPEPRGLLVAHDPHHAPPAGGPGQSRPR